jgi:hypothetical protein
VHAAGFITDVLPELHRGFFLQPKQQHKHCLEDFHFLRVNNGESSSLLHPIPWTTHRRGGRCVFQSIPSPTTPSESCYNQYGIDHARGIDCQSVPGDPIVVNIVQDKLWNDDATVIKEAMAHLVAVMSDNDQEVATTNQNAIVHVGGPGLWANLQAKQVGDGRVRWLLLRRQLPTGNAITLAPLTSVEWSMDIGECTTRQY